MEKTHLSLDVDGAGVKTLVRDLLAKTTAAFAVGTHVAVSWLQAALEEPCAHLLTNARRSERRVAEP